MASLGLGHKLTSDLLEMMAKWPSGFNQTFLSQQVSAVAAVCRRVGSGCFWIHLHIKKLPGLGRDWELSLCLRQTHRTILAAVLARRAGAGQADTHLIILGGKMAGDLGRKPCACSQGTFYQVSLPPLDGGPEQHLLLLTHPCPAHSLCNFLDEMVSKDHLCLLPLPLPLPRLIPSKIT